ncbi:hypothetical protein Pan258_14620 [Symmachiella dynata]|nr:hypothetical protein Pan258_14620 [Symmachiella dynata]
MGCARVQIVLHSLWQPDADFSVMSQMSKRFVLSLETLGPENLLENAGFCEISLSNRMARFPYLCSRLIDLCIMEIDEKGALLFHRLGVVESAFQPTSQIL